MKIARVAIGLFALGAALIACAPSVERGDEDLRIVVISDLNSSYGSTAYEPAVHSAVRMIQDRWRPDLLLIAGDMIAGQRPSLSDENVRAMWSAFDDVVARPLREAGIPYAITVGNHDASAYPAFGRDRLLALEYWRGSERSTGLAFADRAEFPLYYSFTMGDVFVLVWDASNEETSDNAQMMAWAKSALSSDAARSAEYRIVLGHLPLYAVAEGRNRSGEVLAEADSLCTMLESLGVDLYVSGHHHAFYPGTRGELDLLFSGALGQGARQLVGSDAPPVQTATILDFSGSSDAVAFTTFMFEHSGGGDWVRMDIESLPPMISGFNGDVVRLDMGGDG